MRYASAIGIGTVLTAALFASCTCHKELSEPPATFHEPPSGFHAGNPFTPQARVAAAKPTPSVKAPPQEVADAGPTPPAIPDDFPKEVPIFKDATVTHVQDLANNAHNVIFRTTAPVSDVSIFYEQKMLGAGWRVTQQFSRGNHAFFTFQKGDMLANVTVTEDVSAPGKQIIAIMYEQQQPLEFDEF